MTSHVRVVFVVLRLSLPEFLNLHVVGDNFYSFLHEFVLRFRVFLVLPL